MKLFWDILKHRAPELAIIGVIGSVMGVAVYYDHKAFAAVSAQELEREDSHIKSITLTQGNTSVIQLDGLKITIGSGDRVDTKYRSAMMAVEAFEKAFPHLRVIDSDPIVSQNRYDYSDTYLTAIWVTHEPRVPNKPAAK